MSLFTIILVSLLPAFAAASPQWHTRHAWQPSTTSSTATQSTAAQSTATQSTTAQSEALTSAGLYDVPGTGTFTNSVNYTFENGLPSGLSASDYTVQDSPYNHAFTPSNVVVSDSVLNLIVPGGQTSSPISCGEISTDVSNILYASVRTTATFSSVPGTCHGLFFYKTDNQEIDIEYLTSPSSDANSGSASPLMQYTNQATTPGGSDADSYSTGPAPVDATSAAHEYRIDWTAESTTFYLDGVLQKTYTDNVPSDPGSWVWNNWSNGDIEWSAGPPAQENVLVIQGIEMFYNVSSS